MKEIQQEIKICLSDLKQERDVWPWMEKLLMAISDILPNGIHLTGFTVRNKADRETNPSGEIITVTLLIEAPDDTEGMIAFGLKQVRIPILNIVRTEPDLRWNWA